MESLAAAQRFVFMYVWNLVFRLLSRRLPGKRSVQRSSPFLWYVIRSITSLFSSLGLLFSHV
jgi:hypothetical protein